MLLLILANAAAETITQTGSWPGYTRRFPQQVCAEDSTAYVTTTDGLLTLDLSNPLIPQERSFLPCFSSSETPTDICLQSESNRVCIGVRVSYLGNYTYQLKGIDVSDLAQPVPVWSGDLYHQPNQVCLDESKAYSSHNLSGLSVSTWGLSGHGNTYGDIDAMGRIVVVSNRLYVPTVSGFQIFNKSSLALVGTYAAGAKVNALEVAGNYAYLAATNGLHVIDLQNEAAPSPLGFLPLTSSKFEPTDVQLLADHACLIFKKTNLLMVVDVSTPTGPEWVGTYRFTGPTKDLSVNDGRAVVLAADVSSGPADLQVLDLSTPANPALVSRLHATGRSCKLVLEGSTLLVADGDNGLTVLNVGTPSNPQVIGHQIAPGNCVAAANDWVFLGSGGGLGFGFSVYDLSVPENPVLVTNSWDSAFHLDIVGDHLYRIGSYPLLTIMDVRNNFSEIDSLPWIPGVNVVSAFGLAGNMFALMVEGTEGKLIVVDVQTAGLPVTNYLSAAKIVDVVGRADATGTNAFLATTNGLEILDLSDKNNIVRIAEWQCPAGFTPNCICISGDRIGLASPNHLWLIDRNKLGGGNPVIAETDITHSLADMILSGNYLFAAAGADGVIVYQIGSAPSQPHLFISASPPGQVTLQWSEAGTGWFLQQSSEPANPLSWETVAGSDIVTSHSVPSPAAEQFFRLMRSD